MHMATTIINTHHLEFSVLAKKWQSQVANIEEQATLTQHKN
jgi:hypothetical protein